MSLSPNASPPRLKLCTWNLHLGIELGAILRSIDTETEFRDLDLLALQEASVHEGREDAQAIAARMGFQYRHLQVETHVLRGRVQANALVWNADRVRILEQDNLLLPRRVEHPLPRTERALLSVTRLQQRMALHFLCWVNGLAVRLYIAHLDVFGYQHKLQQFNRILTDLEAREPADITIVAGDLNTFAMAARPRWTRLRTAAETAGFEDLTTDIKWTHKPRVPTRQKLDAIFLRCERPLLYESWSLDLAGSDHIPVFAQILGWGD